MMIGRNTVSWAHHGAGDGAMRETERRAWSRERGYDAPRQAERPFGNGKRPSVPVVDLAAFRARLAEERARSDRLGTTFGLVLISVSESDRSLIGGVAEKAAPQLRCPDVVGATSKGTVLVLLPETDHVGTRAVRERIWESCCANVHATVESHLYPDSWLAPDGLARDRERDLAVDSGVEGPRPSDLRAEPSVMPPWKRWTDVTLATIGLVLSAPVLGLAALWIRWVSPGPVIFKQMRIGYRGRPFLLYKLRTMPLDTESAPHRKHSRTIIEAGDAPIGKVELHIDSSILPKTGLIRVLGIDEIPQMWNVLRGEMSIVGPRPCLPYEAAEYEPWHRGRFEAVPGLTGLWQVSGKNRLSFHEMIRLDLDYAGRVRFLRDAWICLVTPPVLLADGWRYLRDRLPWRKPPDQVGRPADDSPARAGEGARVLGLDFFRGTVSEALTLVKRGGLFVFPAAPALVEMADQPAYGRALSQSEAVFADSALMVMLAKMRGVTVPRISGLRFLDALTESDWFRHPDCRKLWVMPSDRAVALAQRWVEESRGLEGNDWYVAPWYSEATHPDESLRDYVEEHRPDVVLFGIGGGKQELVGHGLLSQLAYKPAVVCIGGAVGFRSGDQVWIPRVVDRVGLGWLWRVCSNPRRFGPRYLRALGLVPMVARDRSVIR